MAPDVDEPVPGDELYKSKLYRALMQGDRDELVKLCGIIPEGPLHVLYTLYNETVLHLVPFTMQPELVLELLEKVPQDQCNKLTHQNWKGDTMLHEAAAFDTLVPAATRMVDKEPTLLSMHNNFGETALIRAVEFGNIKMFNFLNGEVNRRYQNGEDIRKSFHQTMDKSRNILHIAVNAEQFEMALLIASKYEYLVAQRDNEGMTPLQLLARKPLAFQSRHISSLRRLIFSFVPAKFTPNSEEVALGWIVPWWEAIKKEKREYEFASTLADFLVQRVVSLEINPELKEVEGNENSSSPSKQKETNHKDKMEGKGNSSTHKQIYGMQLFFATKSGCIDVVEKILDKYPETVEYVDNNGRNILHIAIMYRQMEVFDMVERMKFPMRRLIRKVDKDLNSILHIVGKKEEKIVHEGKMQSPALELRENLLLFERIKKIPELYFFEYTNLQGLTAEQLFAENNQKLREEAQKWILRKAKNFSILGMLIATVAFAAAYTVPGGLNQETGAPILLHEKYFLIFATADALALSCSFTSVIIFLKIITSPFQLQDFKQSLPMQLMLGDSCLFISVCMLMLAFTETFILMIQSRKHWSKTVSYILAFPPLPAIVFALCYKPHYFSLVETVKYLIEKAGAFFPRYVCESRIINTSKSSKKHEIQSSSSNPPAPYSHHESPETMLPV